MPVGKVRKSRNNEQRQAALELKRRIVWRSFVVLSIEHYGAAPPFDDEQEAALDLLVKSNGSPSYLEIVRRMERAFADPEHRASVVTLESVLERWARLAA